MAVTLLSVFWMHINRSDQSNHRIYVALVGKNRHRYCIYNNMVIAEKYNLNSDTQLDAGIPNGSMLICEIISLLPQCGPKFANTSSNCPTDLLSQYERDRDTASAPGSNHEIIPAVAFTLRFG